MIGPSNGTYAPLETRRLRVRPEGCRGTPNPGSIQGGAAVCARGAERRTLSETAFQNCEIAFRSILLRFSIDFTLNFCEISEMLDPSNGPYAPRETRPLRVRGSLHRPGHDIERDREKNVGHMLAT